MDNGGGMYFRCWAEGLVEQSDRAGKQKADVATRQYPALVLAL